MREDSVTPESVVAIWLYGFADVGVRAEGDERDGRGRGRACVPCGIRAVVLSELRVSARTRLRCCVRWWMVVRRGLVALRAACCRARAFIGRAKEREDGGEVLQIGCPMSACSKMGAIGSSWWYK